MGSAGCAIAYCLRNLFERIACEAQFEGAVLLFMNLDG